MIQPIPYEEARSMIGITEVQVPTLGNRSSFAIWIENGLIMMRNSRGSIGKIDKVHWEAVMQRISAVPENEREMTSRYVLGTYPYNWNQPPNKIFSPAVPAIVRYLQAMR
ncbi:MAG: hypothetical protein R8G66_09805 [Cytophagales bacterium]|nr:hypothetical protein [Cytophagales bacterium]